MISLTVLHYKTLEKLGAQPEVEEARKRLAGLKG